MARFLLIPTRSSVVAGTLIALLLSLSFVPLTSVHAAELRTVAQWENIFQGAWAREYATYRPKSLSGDEWPIYNMAYALNANYMMFKATGKTQYLDRNLEYINNMINTARVSSPFSGSQYKDSYLTWVNQSKSENGSANGQEFPLFESFGWRYVAALLYAMKQNADVYNDPHYRAEYDKILAFTEKNIWDKWYKRGLSNLYRTHTHMASHWAMIGMYLSKLTNDATRRSQAETVAKNIAYAGIPLYDDASIKGQLRPHPLDSSAYFFNWEWNKFSTPGSDVSHGNAVASFMTEANCIGFAYTQDDMQKMANLVKNILIPKAPLYVDGSGSRTLWLIDGFMQLGRYDQELAKKLETAGGGETTTRAGAGALNTLILNGGPCTGVNTSGGGGGGGGNDDTTCTNQYTKNVTVPTNYGAAYNLFTSTKELLVQGDTCSATSYKIKVGSGDNAQYVYKLGYKWTGSRWDSLNLTSTSALQSNTWYLGSATVGITPVSGGTYVVGYICQKIGDVWKCGCSDTTCTTPAWQLQKVSK